jgi:cellulose synthase/poly-beta-1,6-N-acetylglucosamine synthase-like glycosyltransferase
MASVQIPTVSLLCLFGGVLPFFGFLLVTSAAALVAQSRSKRRARSPVVGTRRNRFLVAIPAHNEETGIVTTVRSCRALEYPADLFQIVVIADNCTDRTAWLAKNAGARVVERFDPAHKSKGHAIEYLISALARNGELAALDAIVILDADSTAHPDLLRGFSEGLERGDEWIQCYDAVGNAGDSWRTQLMAYAFSLINGVLLRGQSALGLSGGLRGNGMCLSTKGLKRVPWASHGLTEDLEYSWLVRIAGGRISYAQDVAVYATMLSRGGPSAISQRLRWEHGRRTLRRSMIGPLLRSPRLRWTEKLAAVIDLIMPTTSLLLCCYIALTLLTFAVLPRLHVYDRRPLLEYLIGCCYAISTTGLLLHAASPFFLRLIPLRYVTSFAYLPYYVLWKGLVRLRSKPAGWMRTTREQSAQARTSIPAIDEPQAVTGNDMLPDAAQAML